MIARGRSEAIIPSAQREGSPMIARGRSEAIIPSAQREGSSVTAPAGRRPHHALVFIGNAVRAAGHRLGGFATVTPEPGHEVTAVERALKDGAIVVIDADIAEALPPARLERWLANGTPPVAIAPHADGTCSRTDPAERVRVQLGLEA